MRFWRNVAHVIQEADVVIEVVDARMPKMARNVEAEKLIQRSGKELIIAFNKSDLVSDSFKRKIANRLKVRHYFVSALKGEGIPRLRTDLQKMSKKSEFPRLRVGFIGYPNMGKSAVINALSRRAKAKVAKKSGTTRGIQWISTSNLKILDSPGVIPNDEWDEIKLGLIGAKDMQKLKDVEKVALAIIDKFISGNLRALEDFYKLDDMRGKENWEIFEEIGRAKKLLRKKGEIDDKRTSFRIVQDWQYGKLKL
ncbi:GTPase [Candidatus Pacearchaeota archaeon CG10_big_fil_rev_8_21_14_0_10_35_219]|nr:GTPase [Candidatus Pacearchaeota archaeon]OIO43487.1 MAG: hypothetical protein AUJ63_00090 [Candidatus Pacearchaeota archaeon CG1_02_35_32]PIO07610.1 MAG: GTPase [Candidatus Pacearchaeota archaeon CG10_big_fil_rev_8_21_14_0_10_35_219]PIY81844.1 MAG: GTPase [Candidatus Pacearchaeota archaeon CG_4_10_14_0_8_um_filter_35_169]PIZ80710.1 MAG: GTPase [Candidatus Pacearchaeota archaeon CG_4_10_14_0_2_um_filter_35_33]PJA69925.1 MAG: GTPase [Candidatus Pacearchaeota archaeon CG_4_9_14_3_um_filter_35